MQAFSLWQRKQQNFVVVMLDLDNFKTINDKYGHPAGDKVLFAISQLLNRSLRDSDLVGRYGGEEFMLLLHDTEVEAVIDKINDIRERFAELRFKAGIHNFSVTFSAGLANAADFTHSDALLEAADLALYAAKHDGKNCIHTHVETSVTSVHSH
jgi:diguanylate cyclase (GGDEF)-like protein